MHLSIFRSNLKKEPLKRATHSKRSTFPKRCEVCVYLSQQNPEKEASKTRNARDKRSTFPKRKSCVYICVPWYPHQGTMHPLINAVFGISMQ
jgi:hypothetical protein